MSQAKSLRIKVFTLPNFSKKNLRGFTLIELLVVIAIIGFLSTIAVVALNSARAKGRDAKRVADIKQIQTAMELFNNDKSSYPTNFGPGPFLAEYELGKDFVALCDSGFLTLPCEQVGEPVVYMGLIPKDPQSPARRYIFRPTAPTATNYEIRFELEGKTGSLPAGLVCASPSGMKPCL